jgi:hypothetical protein
MSFNSYGEWKLMDEDSGGIKNYIGLRLQHKQLEMSPKTTERPRIKKF